MLHFFDVVYYIKKTFSGVNDVEQMNQKSLAIEKAEDDSNELNKMISDLVIEMSGPRVKVLRDMAVYIHPSNGNSAYKVVDFAVKTAWEAIKEFVIDNNKLEDYRLFLSYLKKTNGASMNSNINMLDDKDKSDLIDDEALQRFVRTFNALKDNKTEHNLYNLVHFIYENELQNVMFRRMNRELNIELNGVKYKNLDERLQDGQKFTDVVPNEALILVPILKEMKDLKLFNNKIRKDFYLSILGVDNYKDDNEFLDEVKKNNHQFIDLNIEKIKEIDNNIGLPDILKKTISKRLEDTKAVRIEGIKTIASEPNSSNTEPDSNTKDPKSEIVNKFKSADVRLTLENLMIEYVGFPKNNKVIDDKVIESVLSLIDENIISMFNYAIRKLSDIEKNELNYKELLKDSNRIRIENGTSHAYWLPLKEIIERWQAFIKTLLFGLEIMDNLLKQIKENENGRFDKLYSGFPNNVSVNDNSEKTEQEQLNNTQEFEYKILKKNVCDNIIRVIENFKTNSLTDRDSSDWLCEITGEKKMSSERLIACKIEILKLLTNFFQTPFDIKKTLQMTKTVNGNTYYDAACILVYIKNNAIKESYIVGDVMLFEGNVLFEERNWTNYFKELSRKVMNFIAKQRKDNKEANVFSYLRDQEKRFEISHDDENNVGQQVKVSTEKLNSKPETKDGLTTMKNIVKDAIQSSGSGQQEPIDGSVDISVKLQERNEIPGLVINRSKPENQ